MIWQACSTADNWDDDAVANACVPTMRRLIWFKALVDEVWEISKKGKETMNYRKMQQRKSLPFQLNQRGYKSSITVWTLT